MGVVVCKFAAGSTKPRPFPLRLLPNMTDGLARMRLDATRSDAIQRRFFPIMNSPCRLRVSNASIGDTLRLLFRDDKPVKNYFAPERVLSRQPAKYFHEYSSPKMLTRVDCATQSPPPTRGFRTAG